MEGEKAGDKRREAQFYKCWGPDAPYGLVLSVVETTGRFLGEKGTWFMHDRPLPPWAAVWKQVGDS